MAIPYTQPSMALVRAVDGTYISYPFTSDGDTTTKVYNLVCTQRASDYNAAQIELDDTMSSAASAGVIDLPSGWADSNAYFVGDTGHTPIGGGMISFTRTFANIPQSITTPSGSESYTFPGMTVPAPVFGGVEQVEPSVSSISTQANISGVYVTLTGGNSSFFDEVEVGRYISISANFTIQGDSRIYNISGKHRILELNQQVIKIDIGLNWDYQPVFSVISSNVSSTTESRDPYTAVVPTTTEYNYILPGVTPWIGDIEDVRVPNKFYVMGGQTSSIADYVRDTEDAFLPGGTPIIIVGSVPDFTNYFEMIGNGTNLVVESSISKWAGNIHVLKTKTVKAQ